MTLCAAAMTGCGPRKAPSPPIVHIGFVSTTAGFGDRAANDAAQAALVACNRETGVRVETAVPPDDTGAEAKFVLFATEKFDTVIGIGFGAAPGMQTAARRFEGTHFALIDAVADLPNIQSITFAEEQGAFLAGALAALVSKTHRIAFIGGADVALLQRSEAGFIAGAREVDARTKVDVRYLHSFVDPEPARAAAATLLAGGADIAFVVAGPAGLGAFERIAASPHALAIGADTDQSAAAPGRVLTSVVKHVGAAVLRVCREAVGGKPESGRRVLGLADGGIGLSETADLKALAGKRIIARVDRIRGALIAGRLHAPGTRAELAGFTPVQVP